MADDSIRFRYNGLHAAERIDSLFRFVGTIVGTSKKPSLNGSLVNDQTILLIVASKANHGCYCVDADWQLVGGDEL